METEVLMSATEYQSISASRFGAETALSLSLALSLVFLRYPGRLVRRQIPEPEFCSSAIRRA